MPNSSIDYSKCIIYKLVCNDLDIKECYIGSTTNFTQRKKQHKKSCNNPSNKEYNTLKYHIIRENGGWNNWSMVEIEKFPCNDHREAFARERYWFEKLHSKMNMLCPFITENERKDKAKELSKNWRKNNTPKLRNEKFVCDCGGRYIASHKATHFKTKIHQVYIQSFSEQI